MHHPLELLVTMWPNFPHFEKIARDPRVAAIRLNTAIQKPASDDLPPEKAIEIAGEKAHGKPLYLDLKGRQLRVAEALPNKERCELILNHRIHLEELPVPVIFKGGNDAALLAEIKDGNHLIFSEGPNYQVKENESLQIRHPSLKVDGLLPGHEIEWIKKAREYGFSRFMLSYVESPDDLKEFRKYVGNSEVVLKIESQRGLDYVRSFYNPQPNCSLLAARGDLFVEVNRPHDIVEATRSIIDADPTAIAASRLMLSLQESSIPSCSDFSDLALLLQMGYHRLMLCDGVSLKEQSILSAINAIDECASDFGYDLTLRYRKDPARVKSL